MSRTLLLAGCLLLGAFTAVRGQSVESVMDQFASYWASGDAAGIAGLAAENGITLDVERKQSGPLRERQVAAVLRDVFQKRETIQVRRHAPQIVGGQPPRAFGEVTWMTQPRGTTIPEKVTVFVAWILQKDRWRITEIRLKS
jgi:hypothetical protein